ncbi:MAG: PD40 domain-containing protein [Flavobacteriales bacterium]|nr:PD40 domain-containing protein [Flavobacteriales bacterium]
MTATFQASFQCSVALAQEYGIQEDLSDKELFKMGNYRGALERYLEALKKDPSNLSHQYIIAQCYLNINDDKSEALTYLEAVWKEDQSNVEVLYDIGRTHHFAMDFDKAIKAFNDYKDLTKDLSKIEDVNRRIKMCHTGKELIKFPLDVTFENLGKKVNSPYPDFTPRVPNDESYMVFTSRRKGNRGNLLDYDGYYTSDVYMSRVKKGEFGKAANVSNINSESDEEVAGISPDGKNVIVFVDDMFQAIYANIYISKKKGRSLGRLVSISDYVNTPSSMETSATISSDGHLLYFASDVQGGFGGMDLYVSRILPDGTWGEAMNLGPTINTKHNEEYPSISFDGSTLHFSSDGHASMGGYDLFVSKKNPKTNIWSNPFNLGYPLNNAEDNQHISFSAIWDLNEEVEKIRYAYISAYRPDSHGDLDIYRVTFGDVEEQLTAITGVIREKLLIDYTTRKTFFNYQKDGVKMMIPAELHPWYDARWSFDEKIERVVKAGYEYKTRLYYRKDGEQKAFSSKKYPKDDPNWKFVKIRNAELKIKGYVQPKEVYEEVIIPDASIYVTDIMSGDEYSYTSSRKGRYIIILPAGSYEIMIDATGYKPKVIPLKIYDKGSYKAEMTKDYIFEKDN